MRRLLLSTLAAALACGRAPPPTDFALRIGVIGAVGEVTPEAHSGGAALATDLVYETLVRPVPGGWDSRFLRRWERLGPRTWRLELLPGRRFSDGSEVRAEDVAEAVRRQGVRPVERSAHDLVVESDAILPLEPTLAFAVVARQEGERYLGTGPFRVGEQEPDRLVLTRVEPAPGRIARVEIVPCASNREALVRLLRGDLGAVPSIDASHAEILEGVPGLRVVRGSGPHAIVVLLNPRLPAAERRALAVAFPLAEVAAAIRREPCCAEGRQARVALPPGRPLTIGYPDSVLFRRAALALRQGLGARGGEVSPIALGDLAARARDFDLFATSALVRPPGILANYLRTGAPWNFQGYSNPRYDAALLAGDEQAADQALAEDPALLVLGRRERVGAVTARIANPQLGDWGILELLPEWQVAP